MNFIYNHAYNSGGRWHIAEDLKTVVTPARTEYKTGEAIDWANPVPLSQIDTSRYYYLPPNHYGPVDGCGRCGVVESDSTRHGQGMYRHEFVERRTYPVLGRIQGIIHTPEVTVATANAACGQVQNIKVSNLRMRDVHKQLSAKKNIGKTVEITHATIRLLVETDFIPEPVCGHCMNKIEAGYVG